LILKDLFVAAFWMLTAVLRLWGFFCSLLGEAKALHKASHRKVLHFSPRLNTKDIGIVTGESGVPKAAQ
jgi:hypothetical protein